MTHNIDFLGVKCYNSVLHFSKGEFDAIRSTIRDWVFATASHSGTDSH